MNQNANRARRYYELIDAGDLDEMYTLFADDIVYRRPGYDPLEGIEAFRDFYEGERVIEHGSHTLRSVVAEGDLVAVEGDFEGVLRDGRGVAVRFADILEFNDGLIVRRDTYFDAPAV
jgi:steroid Delta-isomerase